MPPRTRDLSSGRGDTYEDLADAVIRGVFKQWRGKSLPPCERFRDHYVIQFDRWDNMVAELLNEVIIDARTTQEAARVLDLTEGDVASRLRWARMRWARGARESTRTIYLVALGNWKRMRYDIITAVIADAGSVRAAAPLLKVPRSTLGRWARPADVRTLL